MKVVSLLGVLVAVLAYSPATAGTHEATGYTVITAPELKRLLDSGKEVLLIDTLAESAYKQGHLPGAKHFEFPNGTMDPWDKSKTGGRTQDEFVALLGGDKAKLVVFYCLDEK